MSEERSFEVRQEPDALARRKLGAVTLAGLVTMAGALVAAWLLLQGWREGRVYEPPVAAPRTIGTLEQTLIDDTQRGVDLRREQEASLHRWGWVDRDAGIARVPIEIAIDLVAAGQIPADRPTSPTAPALTTGAPEAPPSGREDR